MKTRNFIPYLKTQEQVAQDKTNLRALLDKERERGLEEWPWRRINTLEQIEGWYQRGIRDLEHVQDQGHKATCSTCNAEFDYVEEFAEPWLGNFSSVNVHHKLTETPPRCLACETKAQAEVEAARRQAEEKARREKERLAAIEAHRQHMEAFFRNNPLAHYYTNVKGTPPCPGALDIVENWQQLDDDDEITSLGLVLVGPSFVGKTTALYRLLHRLAQDGRDCLCINSETLDQIPTWAREGSLPAHLEEFKNVDVLGIDDLDKCRLSPTIAGALWGLAEVRLRQNEAPLFITCNTARRGDFIKLFCRGEADSKLVGESIYNRLRQRCQFVLFKPEVTASH
ncbi:MAG: hypothetical protein AB9869_37285 [Verrucomicrobiia bacterium]